MRSLLLASLCLLTTSLPAFADTVDTVTTVDLNYSNFSGSIDSTSTGAAATLSFYSAIYGGGINGANLISIEFTNSNGIVQDVLSNGPDPNDPSGYYDYLTFYGAASGNALIGTTCSASANTACLLATGSAQELSSVIAQLNGGAGIFNGGTLTVTANDGDLLPAASVAATPEPSSLALLGTGALSAVGVLRRRYLSA